jgi:microcystin-dependent protein
VASEAESATRVIGWLTVDDPGAETCRVLHIPDNFVAHVMGALAELTESYNWEQDGLLTPGECADIMAAMWEGIGECNMIGSIQTFATAVLPDDYLLCDGGQYDRVDYPNLYAVINTSLIVDADHFLVPDQRDRVTIGAGSTWNAGDVFGEIDCTISVDQLPSHAHSDLGHSHGEIIAAPMLTTVGLELPEPTAVPSPGITAMGWANIQNTGGGQPISIMQPCCVWLVGIKCR